MSSYRHLLPALLVASAVSASAAPYVAKPVNDRAKASAHVVVATVAATEARFETNEFGDRLIVSRVRLAVEEAMKGPGVASMDMDLEGGTVGDITLQVSDLPALRPGERAVFFLSPGRGGRLVPHLRGQSILKLDARQRVAGSDVTLAEIREMVRTAK
jgi:hypothetical protein